MRSDCLAWQPRLRASAGHLIVCGIAFAACSDPPSGPGGGACTGPTANGVCLRLISDDLEYPLQLSSPPDDPRLFIVEETGRIRIIADGELLPEPFLDLTAEVEFQPERGLLGLAFHPSFAASGRFYVDYTDLGGNTKVEEFRVGSDPNRADPASGRVILDVEKPSGRHNAGLLRFGPDGYLWIALGDRTHDQNGQDSTNLFGSLMRIDVDGGEPYGVPPDNPFVADPDARDEIWAYGLRNPWRFSFDEPTGMLYVADVGHMDWEELNIAQIGQAGLNYGWPVFEGSHCRGSGPCDPSGKVMPILEYAHNEGCSIIGGEVYRGSALPELSEHYFYGDFCGGWIRSIRYADGEIVEDEDYPFGEELGTLHSFGKDSDGELYALFVAEGGVGHVYRFEPGNP